MTSCRRFVLKSLVALAVSPWLLQAGRAFASPPMRIGVIGSGRLGGTVGRLWVNAGHEVMFSSRHPDELASLVRDLGPRASVGLPIAAAEFGTVLLLAVPFETVPQVGRDLRGAYQGKVVLDATNNLRDTRGAEIFREARELGVVPTVARYLPGARLVRAFSAVNAAALETSAARPGGRVGMPIASDDAQALQIAEGLVRDAGCDPVIVGRLDAASVFQPGSPGFGNPVSAAELRQRLGLPPTR